MFALTFSFRYRPLDFRRFTKPAAAFATEFEIFWIYKLALGAFHWEFVKWSNRLNCLLFINKKAPLPLSSRRNRAQSTYRPIIDCLRVGEGHRKLCKVAYRSAVVLSRTKHGAMSLEVGGALRLRLEAEGKLQRARKMQPRAVLGYVFGPKGKREKNKESHNESSVPEL